MAPEARDAFGPTNAPTTSENAGEDEGGESTRKRSDAPFGGVTPSEAGRLSGEARRKRRQQAEQEALDARRTASDKARIALAKLSQDEWDELARLQMKRARGGDQQAANWMLRYVEMRQGSELPTTAGVTLTAEQRAAILADYAARQEQAAGDARSPIEGIELKTPHVGDGQEDHSLEGLTARSPERGIDKRQTGEGAPPRSRDSESLGFRPEAPKETPTPPSPPVSTPPVDPFGYLPDGE